MKKYMFGISLIVLVILISIFIQFRPKFNKKVDKISTKEFTEVQFYYLGHSEIQLIKAYGFNILVNTGAESDRDEIQDVLEKNNIKKIDYLIITNKYNCFLGNISYILNNYEVEYMYLNNHDYSSKYVDSMYESIKSNFLDVFTLTSTENIVINDLKINIYSPNNLKYSDNSGLVVELLEGDNSILIKNDSSLDVDKDKYTLYVFSTPDSISSVEYDYYIYNSDEKVKGKGKKLKQNTVIQMNTKEFVIK